MKSNLSKDGPSFSRIVAGVMTWGVWGKNFTIKQTEAYINACLELGITTFDHADIYGHYTTESLFGKSCPSSLRDNIQLVSKCGIKLITANRPNHKIKSYDTSKFHLLYSVENSLRQLKTDYLDLLLIHRPSPLMHPEEIAETITKLKASGKVKHFGVSNFTPSQFEMLHQFTPLVTNQVKASLLHLDPMTDGTFDQCLKHQISPMAYSTHASGTLFTSDEERVLRIKEAVRPIAEKHETTYEVILTAWLLNHPAQIFPIMGSTKINRLKAAVEALTVKLSREDWFVLYEASVGEEVA